MTRVVHLEAVTRRHQRRWAAAAVASIGLAALLAIAAGGATVWLRWVLGVVAVASCREAIRLRRSLIPMVAAAVVMLAIVPIDATIDRSVVSGVGALLVVIAAESSAVARRLVTCVPVTTTAGDVRALVRLVGLSTLAAGTTALVALADRWSPAALVGGLVLTAMATTWWIAPSTRPDSEAISAPRAVPHGAAAATGGTETAG